MSRLCTVVLAFAMVWGCVGERVMPSDAQQGGRPLGKVAVEQNARAVVVATVRRDDLPVTGAMIAFSRSIAGRAAAYRWSGMTDEEGQARVEIASGDVTGYYRARASLDGREIGTWSSIPINAGNEARLDLPIGGKARVAGSSPLPIKIGFIYTTPTRNSSIQGATLAAMQLNAEGGVRGARIELIDGGVPIQTLVETDASDTDYVAALAENLIAQEKVAAIVGPNRSRHAVIVAELAQRHGIPMMTTSATNPGVTAAGDFVFMASATDDFQGEVMAEFAVQELGLRRVGILTHKGDVYSEGLSQIFADNFGALGGRVAAHQFYAAGDTAFTAQLTAIAQVAPDGVFLPGFIDEIPLVVQQAKRDFGIAAVFLGGDSWDTAQLIATSGAILEGSFYSSLFSPNAAPGALSADAHGFIDAYAARYGTAPDGGAALGYDALRLVVEAMRRAENLTPEAIRDQIAATENYSGATMVSGYDENRHTAKSAVINRIVNGEAAFYKSIDP